MYAEGGQMVGRGGESGALTEAGKRGSVGLGDGVRDAVDDGGAAKEDDLEGLVYVELGDDLFKGWLVEGEAHQDSGVGESLAGTRRAAGKHAARRWTVCEFASRSHSRPFFLLVWT